MRVQPAGLNDGWTYLHPNNSMSVFYRWLPGLTREEVHINFDRLGRVTAWSIWHNTRQQIDQGRGQRERLEGFLEGRIAFIQNTIQEQT